MFLFPRLVLVEPFFNFIFLRIHAVDKMVIFRTQKFYFPVSVALLEAGLEA